MRPLDLAASYDHAAVVATLIKGGARLGSTAAEMQSGLLEQPSPPIRGT